MKQESRDILDWLQLKSLAEVTKSPVLGAFVTVILGLTLISLIIFGFIALFSFYGALIGFGPFAGDETGAAIRNIGLVLVAMFGAPFLVWRSIVAQKQVNVAEQGHITDRLNKAVEGLGAEKVIKEILEIPRYRKDDEKKEWIRDQYGNPVQATRPDGAPIIDRQILERTEPNVEVRLGAIYALERIALDSRRDHLQVMEILCAYIRENAPLISHKSETGKRPKIGPDKDIQAAIYVIARRSEEQKNIEIKNRFRLDLRTSNLSGIDFGAGDFSAAQFHDCMIQDANFNNCDISGTQFYASNLDYTTFIDSVLVGTRFDRAQIINVAKFGTGIEAVFAEGKAVAVSIVDANVSGIEDLSTEARDDQVFGSYETKLSRGMEQEKGQFYIFFEEYKKCLGQGRVKEADNLEKTLMGTRFYDWFRYCGFEPECEAKYKEMLARRELTGWPYQE